MRYSVLYYSMLWEQRVKGTRNHDIINTIAVVTIGVGFLVIVGWIADIPALTSLHPKLVTMKFVTALCFILSGFSLIGLRSLFSTSPGIALTTLPILAYTILLLMGGLIPALITGAGFGIETFFITQPSGTITTTNTGVPTIFTTICFSVIAVMILLAAHHTGWAIRSFRWAGSIVGCIGSVLLIDSIVRGSASQSYILGFPTAMAVHTAALFTFIGIALLLLSRNLETHASKASTQ